MNSSNPSVIGFAAYSGTGKTTLLSHIIPLLLQRGLRVGVLKHAHHDFTIDTPGKDSYEFRKAGAEQVLIASRNRIAWMTERSNEDEPTLRDMLEFYKNQPLDLIVVEGFKQEPFQKIEVHRATRGPQLLARSDKHVIAVATDSPESVDAEVLILDLNDHEAIAQFIMERITSGGLKFPDFEV